MRYSIRQLRSAGGLGPNLYTRLTEIPEDDALDVLEARTPFHRCPSLETNPTGIIPREGLQVV